MCNEGMTESRQHKQAASSVVLYHRLHQLFNLNNGNRDDEGQKIKTRRKGGCPSEKTQDYKYKHFKKTLKYALPQKHPKRDLKEDKKGN